MAEAATANLTNQRIVDEFKRPFWGELDQRFIITVLICIILEAVVVFFLANRPVPEVSEKEIARIQERFANLVLGEEAARRREAMVAASTVGTSVTEGEEGTGEEIDEPPDEEPGAGEGEGSGIGDGVGDGTGGPGEVRRPTRMEAAEARRQTREAISREVSNRGILGLLTGTGTAAEGTAVSSIFSATESGAGGDSDLDALLSSVDGLKTDGAPGAGGGGTGGGSGTGGGVRGSRSGRKAGIDDLVSDLGTVESQSLERRGELVVEAEAPADVEGTGRRSVYRSPDAIQEVLIAHNAAIRYCYERELKRTPSLKGKITVRITVAPNGHVTNAEIVESTLNSERVERCILARIRLWKDFKPIDNADGDVTFRQVYTFGY